jgi:uncharacterized protein YegL
MEYLPVYFLLDTSGSMRGEPILSLQNGLQSFVSTLIRNQSTFGRVLVSVITFGDNAEMVVPLVDINSFSIPKFEIYGCTALGDALNLVAQEIDMETKVDDYRNQWRPVVFVLTDGEPTDNYNDGLYELRKRNIGNLVVCIAGQGAHVSDPWLVNLSDCVTNLDTTDSNTLLTYILNTAV